MGRYTALEDPLADEIVADHMQQIITAVRSRLEPQAIILRGSFGRGEGSVLLQDGHLRFLSDYEIDVATLSPFYRSTFSELSHQLTAELDVAISLRWVRPDYIHKKRVGPIPVGSAPNTISKYESRHGSQTLYGHDIHLASPAVDPRQIPLTSGIRLILNRMAESSFYLPNPHENTLDDLRDYYWINKTILACAESLLLLWGQYHYSYEERGRRFAALARERFEFINDQVDTLFKFVARATEFKLRPRRDLYKDTVHDTWLQFIPICDTVFRHLVKHAWGFTYIGYSEYPDLYLQRAADNFRSKSFRQKSSLKLLDVYRYIRKGRLPRGLSLPYGNSEIVYSVTPVLFFGWANDEEVLTPMLSEARRKLAHICTLGSHDPNLRNEWRELNQNMLWAWENLCI